MNGRTIGDLFGKCTSHQWNGSSVVDYFLTPNNFAKKIENFNVDEYMPWLSDHCPIYTTIVLKYYRKQLNTHSEDLISLTPRIRWDENAKIRYLEGLKSIKVESRIENLINNNNIKPYNLAAEIKDILISNVEKCKLKRGKPQSKKDHPTAPWFDYECKTEKQNLHEISRKLKKNPHDLSTRTELFNQKRKFKKLVKTKKCQYKCDTLTKMPIQM